MEESESRTIALEGRDVITVRQNLARAAGGMKTQNCVTYKEDRSDPSELIYSENVTQILTGQFRNDVYSISSFPALFAI
jgi:hypothetical protein